MNLMLWLVKELWIIVIIEEHWTNYFHQWMGKIISFDQNDQIIVIAATNLPDSLDTAVTRSGRFDRTVHIPTPNFKSWEKIFEHYLNKSKNYDNQINLQKLAGLTTGLTGADIKNLVNMAGFSSIKEKWD